MFCQACFDDAHRAKTMRRHKTSPIGGTGPLLCTPMMCSVHPDKTVGLYCSTDEQLVCVKCAVTTHSGHKMIEVEEWQPSEQDSAAAMALINVLKQAIADVNATKPEIEARRVALHGESMHFVTASRQASKPAVFKHSKMSMHSRLLWRHSSTYSCRTCLHSSALLRLTTTKSSRS